jgi:hypothetical protein
MAEMRGNRIGARNVSPKLQGKKKGKLREACESGVV